ncbi:MAG: LCP family protein [Eubacteriaceae bacterium]|jgi:LCP family protein required for cell wall assembly
MYENEKDKPKTIIGRKRPARPAGSSAAQRNPASSANPGNRQSSGVRQNAAGAQRRNPQSSSVSQNGRSSSSGSAARAQANPRQQAGQHSTTRQQAQAQQDRARRLAQEERVRRQAQQQQARARQAQQQAAQGRRIQQAQQNPSASGAASRNGQSGRGTGSGQRRTVQGGQTAAKREAVRQTAPQKVKKRRKWPRRLARVLLVLVCIMGGAYAYLRYGPLNTDLSRNVSLYNISDNAAAMASSERIVNVAIFGVDGRSDVEGDRSDSIMIASADFEHNKLKVTSLMRDTYTYNEQEKDYDKLNAAYALGGPDLALKVINENFDTPITDYITVNFDALVEMVNSVGGVEINVTDEEELYWINQYLMDVNDKVGTADPDVAGTGLQTLTGSQALAYSRIRYTGNGDYDRTQRQRNVLQQVVTKAKALGPVALYNLMNQTLPYIETSLSKTEIMKYMLNVITMGSSDIEQFRLPTDTYVTDGYVDGVSYVFPMTLTDNIEAWYQFVYEKSYTPSKRAQQLSSDIQSAYTNS